MRIRILGGGWYGCHLTKALASPDAYVELHEITDRLFSGASGANPARLHMGFHYPRSKLTRAFCQVHQSEFLREYGHLTRHVQSNIYAVAAHDSLVDFGNYVQSLRNEVEFVTVHNPKEVGLENIEGAVLTGERHIVIDEARKYFEDVLGNAVHYSTPPEYRTDFDWTIDCTFCSNSGAGVDRYEPCVTALFKGPTDRAVTVMDGPFPSLYPWNEKLQLNSLTSARLTPFSKNCRTWQEAKDYLQKLTRVEIEQRVKEMSAQMAYYWPEFVSRYEYAEPRLSIRAMPRSGADARLVEVSKDPDSRTLRVRAGKIDAVLHAEHQIKDMLKC